MKDAVDRLNAIVVKGLFQFWFLDAAAYAIHV